jgi:DNA-binding NarL/FixJ family response regulator
MKQSSLSGLSLIIHEENAFYRRSLRSLIGGERLRGLVLSEDFSSLADKAWTLRPDIIIFSWDEGAQNRREFVAWVRSGYRGFDRETRIVATSDSSKLKHVNAMAAAGVNAVLLKPFNAKSALVQLERMGAHIAQAREMRQKELMGEAPRHFHRSTI